jgi:hypothetical protein
MMSAMMTAETVMRIDLDANIPFRRQSGYFDGLQELPANEDGRRAQKQGNDEESRSLSHETIVASIDLKRPQPNAMTHASMALSWKLFSHVSAFRRRARIAS